MVSKILEIRDRATFIPVLAVQLGSDDDQERWLLHVSGYGSSKEEQKKYVIIAVISGGEPIKAHVDFPSWENKRTMSEAHRYIEENFDSIKNGAVVDVEALLGEVESPKQSDRFNRMI